MTLTDQQILDGSKREIPAEILRLANRDPATYGHVHRGDLRFPILSGERVVGFVTPRATPIGYRLGPIYVIEDARGRGLARATVLLFRDRGLVACVPDVSPASHAMHRACGFIPFKRYAKGTWYRLPVAPE